MYFWFLIVGGFISFFNAWGIGANDCANSFATSVGSGVLTLKKALIIAGIFEFLGSLLMGALVSDTVRKKIVDISIYESNPYALMLGMLTANFSAGIWLTIASYFRYPVSTTHSIIGAIIGFSMAYGGTGAVAWNSVGFVVLSWILSPILSGLFSFVFYYLCKRFVFTKDNAYNLTLQIFPVLIFSTFLINTFFIFYKGSPQYNLKDLPPWISVTISLSISVFLGLLTYFLYVPYIRKKINNMFNLPENSNDVSNSTTTVEELEMEGIKSDKVMEIKNETGESHTDVIDVDEVKSSVVEPERKSASGSQTENTLSRSSDSFENFEYDNTKTMKENIKRSSEYTKEMKDHLENSIIEDLHKNAIEYDPKVERACTWLQVITACFSAFTHGANDVANSIAPFATVYAIQTTSQISPKSEIPIWMLAMGGIGIMVGLGTWGYKIIKRIGSELTKITPSRGFIIELSDALAVLIATQIKMPVSTTHCQVGSVVGCGLADGKGNVKWSLVKNIVYSWIITLPVTGFISAGLFSYAYYSPFNTEILPEMNYTLTT